MNRYKLILSFTLLLTLSFSGCPDIVNILEDTQEIVAPSGKGYLILKFDGDEPQRTIMPAMPDVANLFYKLDFSEVSGLGLSENIGPIYYTSIAPVLLDVGTWNLTVSAYNDAAGIEITAQTEITGIVITGGATVTQPVLLEPITTGSGKGTFKWDIRCPPTVTIASMTIEKIPGGTPITYFFIGGTPQKNKTDSTTLETGYYFVTLNLTIDNITLERKEILHIYQNMESSYNNKFEVSNFFAQMTGIEVDAANSQSVYVMGETLNIYLIAIYQDGSKSVLLDEITSDYDPDSYGIQYITITHTNTGKDANFTVTVLDYAARIGGKNYPTLYEAIDKADLGNAVSPTDITILRNITAPEKSKMANGTGYTIPNNKHIRLIVDSGQERTITAEAGNFRLFSVTNSSSLTLGQPSGGGKLTLNGNDKSAEANRNGVYLNGGADRILNMYNNVTIKNFNSDTGGGVYNNGGTFNMNGGEISGNTATNFGGGVYLNGGTFTMNNGKISDNTATNFGGGVYLNGGTFTMNDGKILNNEAKSNGGGVHGSGGTFAMIGGEISGNINTSNTGYGGGVAWASSGNFTMSGGKISSNITPSGGGGVYVSNGTFNMSGTAQIKNHTAPSGGGVYVSSTGNFSMSGGEISGNMATTYGGGVYKTGTGTFTMSGGTIGGTTGKENTANNGGGVYVLNGNFTMTDGEISGNTASASGGGVYKTGTGTFTMSGGTIGGTGKGNTASSSGGGGGGGVYIGEGTFTMTNGEISGNKAASNSATGGGGVNISSSGTFEMKGGKISGNTSNTNGGGVSSAGTFTMSGGTIYGSNETSDLKNNVGDSCNGVSFYFNGGSANYSGAYSVYNPFPGTTNDTLPPGKLIQMVLVPGGSFYMGSSDGNAPTNEKPQHSVTLTAFYMSKYEVTQKQYQAVMGANPSIFGSNPASSEVQDNRPLEYISWFEAIVFCNRLSLAEGLTPAYSINGSTDTSFWGTVPTDYNSDWNDVKIKTDSTGYRLPTEAQWEYAARGGSGSTNNYTYSGSNTADNVSWYYSNSENKTHEVGKKTPNGLGLYDMTGNVEEWCWDGYSAIYYQNSPTNDPQGPLTETQRVIRGGGYSDSETSLVSTRRSYASPYSKYSTTGLRLVRPN